MPGKPSGQQSEPLPEIRPRRLQGGERVRVWEVVDHPTERGESTCRHRSLAAIESGASVVGRRRSGEWRETGERQENAEKKGRDTERWRERRETRKDRGRLERTGDMIGRGDGETDEEEEEVRHRR